MVSDKKINQTKLIIEKYLNIYKYPVIMHSFSKKCVVLRHLINSVKKNVPCVYQKEPFLNFRQSLANQIIEKDNLTIYNYPPKFVVASESKDNNGNNTLDFANLIQLGEVSLLTHVKTCQPDFTKPCLCGFFDFLAKPKGSVATYWDCFFVGYQLSDKNSVIEIVNLKNLSIIPKHKYPDMISPLQDWTDEEINSYIKKFNIPYPENTSNNDDIYPVCTNCLDKRNDKSVFCPKFKRQFPNISYKVPYYKLLPKITFWGNNYRYRYEAQFEQEELIINQSTYNEFVNSLKKRSLAQLEINPQDYRAFTRLGISYQYASNIDKAIECFKKAIELKNDYPDAQFNLGVLLLLTGDFDKGFEYLEQRYSQSVLSRNNVLSTDKPLWIGENIKGKTIYIYPEQGFGDIIQTARFFPLIKEMGANIIFNSPPELKSLFEANYPDINVISTEQINFNFDTHTSIFSIPYLLKANAENMPFKNGYLKANPTKVKEYKEKYFLNNKFKIGLIWHCKDLYFIDRFRSIPSPELFKNIFEMDNVQIYSLQKENNNEILNYLNIINLGNDFKDFSDTAAAIENLDLIITVDTSVAHLAGALGKKTFILLEKFPSWRWGLNTDKSYLYNSAKLFRQTEAYEWQEVIDKIHIELLNMLNDTNN